MSTVCLNDLGRTAENKSSAQGKRFSNFRPTRHRYFVAFRRYCVPQEAPRQQSFLSVVTWNWQCMHALHGIRICRCDISSWTQSSARLSVQYESACVRKAECPMLAGPFVPSRRNIRLAPPVTFSLGQTAHRLQIPLHFSTLGG